MLDKTTCFISNIFEKMLKKQVHYQTPRGFTTVVKLLSCKILNPPLM